MSKKTLLKRIALVAVSALGAGLMAVAPASASDSWSATNFQVDADTLCTDISDTGTLTVPLGATMKLAVDDSEDYTWDVVMTGPVALSYGNSAEIGTVGGLVLGTNDLGQTLLEDDYGMTFGEDYVTLTATAVGTATIADTTSTGRIDTSDDLTIKIVASCATNVYSAADSFISTTNDPSEDNAEDWYTEVYEDGAGNNDKQTYAQADGSLYIRVIANNAYGDELPAGAWSASATNGATVVFGDTAYIPDANVEDAGTLPVDVVATAGDGGLVVRVDPKEAGVPQTTTVTVSRNGVVLATKNLTFYGEATKVNIVGNVTGLNGEDGYAFFALTDAAGNRVPGSLYVDPSTLTNRINSAVTAFAAADNVAYPFGSLTLPKGVGIFSYACNPAYGSGGNDLTVKHDSSINATTLSATVKAVCAGPVDTYTVSTDKATYKIGEIATITVTAKDSSGAAVSDQAEMGAGVTLTAGGMLQIGSTSEDDTFTAGSKSYKFQVITAGSFNVVALINGTTTKSATASYTVTSGDTSLNDVLAAIVKLIGSINKQIKALQKSLKKK